jgi:hypothetical protein
MLLIWLHGPDKKHVLVIEIMFPTANMIANPLGSPCINAENLNMLANDRIQPNAKQEQNPTSRVVRDMVVISSNSSQVVLGFGSEIPMATLALSIALSNDFLRLSIFEKKYF